jgi:hypothetical protein
MSALTLQTNDLVNLALPKIYTVAKKTGNNTKYWTLVTKENNSTILREVKLGHKQMVLRNDTLHWQPSF